MWPVLPWPTESVLDLDPFVLLLPKKSRLGLWDTLLSSEGLNRPDRLDISVSSKCVVVAITPGFEVSVGEYASDWFRELALLFSTGLATFWLLVEGDAGFFLAERAEVGIGEEWPGKRPNRGNSNEKLTSFGLLSPPPRLLLLR